MVKFVCTRNSWFFETFKDICKGGIHWFHHFEIYVQKTKENFGIMLLFYGYSFYFVCEVHQVMLYRNKLESDA